MNYESFTTKEIADTMNVTLTSFMLLVQNMLSLIPVGGNIIAISGTFENGGKGWLPYFTAKRGLEDFIVGLADELKDRGIYVNAISPSDTATSAYAKFFPEFITDSLSPIKIAHEVLQLVTSEETGKIIVVQKDREDREHFHA